MTYDPSFEAVKLAEADGGGKTGGALRTLRIAALLLVALPILFNAIALAPELHASVPGDNDEIFHYLFIERANQAISAGDNPFDHWLPELELGFPQFLYYQNLPHLTVVAVHRLLLERVSLLTVLNLIRYLLMVLFPLTVFWSMRRMEFSMVAAAAGAAFSSTLSSQFEYGFDYHSYVWGGFGMFPQLCAMHLTVLGTACLRRVLERGKGYAAAIITSAALVLSDLLYGYIFAVGAVILLLLSAWPRIVTAKDRGDAGRRLARLGARFAAVAIGAALITAYQTVPFFQQLRYLNRVSPGQVPHTFSGFSGIGLSLLKGQVFDHNRLPILTVLVAIGILYALRVRSAQAKLTLAFFVTYGVLSLGRLALGPLVTLLPLVQLLPLSRFVAGSDFSAIMFAGLAGEIICKLTWQWWPSRWQGLRTVAPLLLLFLLCSGALTERWDFYNSSAIQMAGTDKALEDDSDLHQVLSTLRHGPPGRVYAGTRGNWGSWMGVGDIYLFDLLPIEMLNTVMPWQTLSLDSPFLWSLNIPSLKLCELFNIRYIVAPPILKIPASYKPLLATSSYSLYQVDSGGYLQLGQIASVTKTPFGRKFFAPNRDWIASDDPTHGNFIAFRDPSEPQDSNLAAASPVSTSKANGLKPGVIDNEVITPDSLRARVSTETSMLLVFKMTYHPNWHVDVDGHQQHAFMVSPGFIGVQLTKGTHRVSFEYRSSRLKKILQLLSLIALVATFAISFRGLEASLFDDISD